jgi:hypothetical protein
VGTDGCCFHSQSTGSFTLPSLVWSQCSTKTIFNVQSIERDRSLCFTVLASCAYCHVSVCVFPCHGFILSILLTTQLVCTDRSSECNSRKAHVNSLFKLSRIPDFLLFFYRIEIRLVAANDTRVGGWLDGLTLSHLTADTPSDGGESAA